ncbi:MAG: ABC transporter ATP-binding protein [Planctomycetes bacterium]|nr:ABC transporter ATP-binding protein [Planctomycetota bacterium]
MAGIRLEHVKKAFGSAVIIPDLSLEIPDGAFSVFVGPSGCGKSTLLRLIAGLEETTAGNVYIGGRDVTWMKPSERKIAMVFQSYALFPHMTVAENIGFGLKLAKRPKDEIARKVQEVAAVLQLEDQLKKTPKQLSGGQRQRVAIGRAISREPDAFLFDEPLSTLDAALRVQMRLELADLHRRLKSTMVYVTHDQVEAMTLADQIVVLNKGSIMQVGSPMELYQRPANLFTAGFIGSPKINLVEVEQRGNLAVFPDGQHIEFSHARPAVQVGIRPEHFAVKATAEKAFWPATIKALERLGAETYLYVEAGRNGAMTVRHPGDMSLAIGDQVGLDPLFDNAHFFDQDGQTLPRAQISLPDTSITDRV